MKVYLAAPFAGRDVLKEQVPIWEKAGFEVTCGWVRSTRELTPEALGSSPQSSDEEAQLHAEMDLADVDAADALVHYTAAYLQLLDPSLGDVTHKLHSGGRHFESGYALANGKQVVVIGEPENIFQRGLCLSAMDVEGAMEALRWSAEHGERFGW